MRLTVKELKIDKSFVLNMERDADNAKNMRSTIDPGNIPDQKHRPCGMGIARDDPLRPVPGCYMSKPTSRAHLAG